MWSNADLQDLITLLAQPLTPFLALPIRVIDQIVQTQLNRHFYSSALKTTSHTIQSQGGNLCPMIGRANSYFTQVKCTGTLFDSLCSGEITFSCTHSSTVLPGFPNFHLWLTPLTPGSENLRRCSGQVRPWESTHVYVTKAERVVVIWP